MNPLRSKFGASEITASPNSLPTPSPPIKHSRTPTLALKGVWTSACALLRRRACADPKPRAYKHVIVCCFLFFPLQRAAWLSFGRSEALRAAPLQIAAGIGAASTAVRRTCAALMPVLAATAGPVVMRVVSGSASDSTAFNSRRASGLFFIITKLHRPTELVPTLPKHHPHHGYSPLQLATAVCCAYAQHCTAGES